MHGTDEPDWDTLAAYKCGDSMYSDRKRGLLCMHRAVESYTSTVYVDGLVRTNDIAKHGRSEEWYRPASRTNLRASKAPLRFVLVTNRVAREASLDYAALIPLDKGFLDGG